MTAEFLLLWVAGIIVALAWVLAVDWCVVGIIRICAQRQKSSQ